MTGRQIAVDIGGTFTDVAVLDGAGRLRTTKVSSDPENPARAVAAVLDRLAADGAGADWKNVLHGTTVGTNALLEGKTPEVALVTTEGFRDVLKFRRLKRGNLYSIGWSPTPPLVRPERILEVTERVGADGEVVQPLAGGDLERVSNWLRDESIESVAICLLHAHRNDEHERAIAEHLAAVLPDVLVTTSSTVAPEMGEYERMSTTVVHASLKPVLGRYVGDLEVAVRRAPGGRLFVVQSNGGLATARQITEEPARAVESGPAAGALFASVVARRAGVDRAIAFDMGGTTAKACLLEDGQPAETGELHVGGGMHAGEGFRESDGYVIRGRAVDLVEVGAGGGSLCKVDDEGVLHVGPDSAGAMPGPAAYGRGNDVPTVTDASLVLGVLVEEGTADVTLDAGLARKALDEHVAQPLGIPVEDAAWLVLQVANSNMMRAIQAVSSERGRDPEQYTLIAFGGGGPAHAVALAEQLGMHEILIPPAPDVFSAVGLHSCPVRRDLQRPVMLPAAEVDREDLERIFRELEGELRDDFIGDGLAPPDLVRLLDVRFPGQSTSLTLPAPEVAGDLVGALRAAYGAAHRREYGHVDTDAVEVEVVACRVAAEGVAGGAADLGSHRTAERTTTTARVYFGPDRGWREVSRIPWSEVSSNEDLEGPVLVQADQSVVVIPPGSTARLDGQGHIRIQVGNRTAGTLPGGGWEDRAGLQLFRNALGAILDRMAFTVARTAYSTMASDAHDFSFAIGDGAGRVVDQGVGVLIHLGSVASALEALQNSELVPLAPGDVVLLNDPYGGGTHLPDCIVVVPVFHDGELVAHTVAISHMIDIGGLVAGSFMASARELMQEGLVIPPLKLYDRGEPNRAVLDIIRRNVRQPAEVVGDIQGLVAAARLGATAIERLVADVGREAAISLMDELIEYAGQRGQRELLELGTAEAEFVDHLDGDGVTDEPVRLQVHLRVENGRVTADFTGSSPQRPAGINATISTTRSILQYCIRTQMTEDYPDNAGFHGLLEIVAPRGTVVNASDDAPVANRGITAFRLVDAIFGAMAQMFPGRIWAAGDGSLDPITFGGRRDDGSRFTVIDIVGGTTGARPWSDGIAGVAPPVGNARNNSVEVLESRYPLRVTHYGQEPGTGGWGRFRGGNAVTRGYELLCDEAEVAIRSDRQDFRPWGLEGGGEGAPSRNLLLHADGSVEELPSKHVFTLYRGERVVRQGAGGGGYGVPPEDAAEDT